jgi:hypothetical protein
MVLGGLFQARLPGLAEIKQKSQQLGSFHACCGSQSWQQKVTGQPTTTIPYTPYMQGGHKYLSLKKTS